MKVDDRVHAGEPRYGDLDIEWHEGTCSYCGSLRPSDVVQMLKMPGVDFSGTDKTGYKAYVGQGKFYFRHLRELSDTDLAEFDALSRKVFGLSWQRNEKGDIYCRYPRSGSHYGWQTWGVIGSDGEPRFAEGAPTPPDADWWAAQK